MGGTASIERKGISLDNLNDKKPIPPVLKLLDEHLEDIILVILMSVMSIFIFIQVVMRYVFKNPLAWTEELARYIFIWLSYLAIPYATRLRKHVKIEAALYLFPKKLKPVIIILGDLISFAFILFLVYTTYIMVQRLGTSGQTSPAVGIPMVTIYAAPFVGFLITTIRMIQTLYIRITNLVKGVEMND